MSRATAAAPLLLCVLALGATAGEASAARLTLSEGGVALAPGDRMYAEEGRIEVNTSAGPIECPFSPLQVALYLSVVTNSKGKDELEINGLHERQFEPCRSFTGNTDVVLRSLGSFVKLDAEGNATAGWNPTLELLFEHEEHQGGRYENVECLYRRERLPGTSTATPSPQALQLEFDGVLPLRPALSSAKARDLCPAEAEPNISWPYIEGEPGIIEEHTST
jgi:hypothetical protein